MRRFFVCSSDVDATLADDRRRAAVSRNGSPPAQLQRTGIGGRQVLPRGRGGPPERGNPEERRDAARDEGGRPLGFAARLPRVRDAHHGGVGSPKDFPNVAKLFLFLVT